jgi:hypothetical protein
MHVPLRERNLNTGFSKFIEYDKVKIASNLARWRLEYKFFVCNFYEFFEEDSNNLFILIRLASYGEFGCGRRPR